MASHNYTEVPTSAVHDDKERNEKIPRKFFWRQFFVSSVIWTPYLACGICYGTPTVYIAQMRREANSTEAVSSEMVSWLSSVFAYVAVPWCLILAFLVDYIGRKKTCALLSINQVVVAISYYLSVTPMHLLITEAIHGMTQAGSLTVCLIAIAEYTSPINRGLFLTLKSATVFWSIWAANAIGTFASWRYITILGFINSFYSLNVFFWPESPAWLASQGRYDECKLSHRWLKGTSNSSEMELELLINAQFEARKIVKKRTLLNTFRFLVEREFYYPVIISLIVSIIYLLSGKQVITIYAIDIIKQITSSEATAYESMLILDAVSVVAMSLGCFVSKIVKRRFLLFFFGSISVTFLLVLSLYLYLVHLSLITNNKYVSVCLLVGFSIAIGMGPLILATSITAEMIPLKYKGQAMVVIAWSFFVFQAITLKNVPFILRLLDMHGMFLFYGLSVSVCLIILYKYLPETKDRTLEEIQKHFL